MPWKIKYSQSLIQELARLEAGNEAETQRLKNFHDAVLKVKSDPLHNLFKKTLPDDFKAVDVLQQYRAFFKLHRTGSGDYIHFVWLNTEESIHASGTATDAYQAFRDLHARGQIEAFQEDQPVAEPKFYLSGKWGDKTRYAKCIIPPDGLATSIVTLAQTNDKSYALDSITVKNDDWTPAFGLVEGVCGEADKNGISLFMDLRLAHEHYAETTAVLEANGFGASANDGELETWERPPA